jgi:hypothetical protein
VQRASQWQSLTLAITVTDDLGTIDIGTPFKVGFVAQAFFSPGSAMVRSVTGVGRISRQTE